MKTELEDRAKERTRSLSTAAIILHPSFSPKPTMLSLDLGDISSMTCGRKVSAPIQYIEVIPRTCVADKNALKLSQSLIISASSSSKSSFLLRQSRAAVICSARMRSTVLWNESDDDSGSGSHGPVGDPKREHGDMRGKSVSGVAVPDCTGDKGEGGCSLRRASDAARSRRLVVPSALVDPERAEQTIASLC
jgi:hypothetical protein